MTVARPPNTGVVAGRLHDCPASPNCVCSFAPAVDGTHAIAPLTYAGDWPAARSRLLALLQRQTGCRVVEQNETYLRCEFRTRWLRFVDDVEFLADPAAQVIHVRSASRLGYSDLGVNRRRIEQIRRQFS